MRTLAQMKARVRRLAHDLAQKSYDAVEVGFALEDALSDLVDRLLDDDLGMASLLAVGDAADPDDSTSVDLPDDCLRLLRVEAQLSDGSWRELPRRDAGEYPVDDDVTAFSATAALVEEAGEMYAGASVPVGFALLADGEGIELLPREITGVTMRFVYLREVEMPTVSTDCVALPNGADEILELIAADKLTADEPRDQKRMVMYNTRLESRYSRWVKGRGRGKVDRSQQIAGEL